MTSSQNPLGSGFGADTTTADVLGDRDLSGTLAVVTGGYSGIGLATVAALAGAGARVVVPARRPDAARQALADVDGVEVDELDLADPDSIGGFADRFLSRGQAIDVLVANAGIMAAPLQRVGPGWEAQLATNHLGHYALVCRLWPALAADGGARVVSVSSSGNRIGGIRWEDPNFEVSEYDRWAAYGQSKTANVLFAVHLDALGQTHGVRAFSLHPGVIDTTGLDRHLSREDKVRMGWINEDGTRAQGWASKTAEQGAATSVWAATSPQLDGLGGVYLENCDVAEIVAEDADFGTPGIVPHAIDPGDAARLWSLSGELTAVDVLSG